MKVLVCGGRNYTDFKRVCADLDKLHSVHPITEVIEGGARGADTLAREWAISRNISYREFPADWAMHGKAAGPIRNKQMLLVGKPDRVVAFPGGKGTENMIAQSKAANIPVQIEV